LCRITHAARDSTKSVPVRESLHAVDVVRSATVVAIHLLGQSAATLFGGDSGTLQTAKRGRNSQC
jgi:hypothetical protein